MSGADLFSVEGATSDYVETAENVPASPIPTPILTVTPDRGLVLTIRNRVENGEQVGVPIFMKLRDSNGDPLPPTTSLFLAVKRNGDELPRRVSEKKGNISFYTTNDLTTQRNADNVDSAKFVISNGEEAMPGINIRDVDEFYIIAEGPTAIDHGNSEIYIDSSAVDEGSK